MSDRVGHIASALETIRVASQTLAPVVEADAGAALLEYWRTPSNVAWGGAASALAARLIPLFRIRSVAEVIASDLPAGIADVVLVWAESVAGRSDVVLAPLLAAPGGTAGLRERAAAARVHHGPLFDALHALPAAWGMPGLEHRIAQLVWEAGARGWTLPALGRWAWSTPGVVRSLIIDPARGHLGARVQAARALGLFADGFSEDRAPGLARVVIGVAQTLLEHREPTVWTAAARGLGRFALGSTTARMAVFRAATATRLSARRRNLAVIGSLSPAIDAETWIDEQLDRAMSETARRDDPWALAALAVATPFLLRDRPETFDRLCSIALGAPSLELAWSLAQGFATISRDARGRGVDEDRRASQLRVHVAGLALEQALDLSRRAEALVELDRALGRSPELALVSDLYDAALHDAIERQPVQTVPSTVAEFTAAFAELDDPVRRGLAIARLRSATRAHAMQLSTLVFGERVHAEHGSQMLDAAGGRLVDQTCEYGVRTTLVGVMSDLVAGEPHGTGGGELAARALLALARSRWMREIAEPGAAKTMKRDIQRFRKPIEDLLFTCFASHRGDDDRTVPPALAAWWTLCAGSGSVLSPIERTPGSMPATELEACIRDDVPVTAWGPRAVVELDRLGVSSTALGEVFARLVGVLTTIETAGDVPRRVAEQQLRALRAVSRAMLSIGHDLDDAFGPASAFEPGDPTAPPSWIAAVPTSVHVTLSQGEPWERLVPLLAAKVTPIAERLLAQLAAPMGFEASPGGTFGPYVLEELLGSGGMGEVWRARRGRRLVALKLARTDGSASERAALAAVLRAEADNLEPLAFAKVAILIDAGAIDDTPFLAMSYVRGRTLSRHLMNDQADLTGAHLPLLRRIVRDICIGLDNLHRHGLVHRDLKPANVMLRMRGTDADPLRSLADDPRGDEIDEAVLIDFGIAHAFHAGGARGATPGYAAPETAAGEPVGPAADIYALGASLFHLLARRPLTGDRIGVEAMRWHLETEPVEDPDVRTSLVMLPAPLADLIAAACRHEPEQRITLAALRAAFDH